MKKTEEHKQLTTNSKLKARIGKPKAEPNRNIKQRGTHWKTKGNPIGERGDPLKKQGGHIGKQRRTQ